MNVRTGICILRHCRHEADCLGGHAARARCCLIFGKLEERAGKGHEARSGIPCKGGGGRQVIRLYIIEIEARAVTARSTRHFVLQNEKDSHGPYRVGSRETFVPCRSLNTTTR